MCECASTSLGENVATYGADSATCWGSAQEDVIPGVKASTVKRTALQRHRTRESILPRILLSRAVLR
jgi:hypothetical protein